MKLLTQDIQQKLLKNWPDDKGLCLPPLKLFNPCGAATWLITCMDPDCPDILFGLADLGMGFPELGSVSLSELRATRLPFGLTIERDRHFEPAYPIRVYAAAARIHRHMTFDLKHLEAAARTVEQQDFEATVRAQGLDVGVEDGDDR